MKYLVLMKKYLENIMKLTLPITRSGVSTISELIFNIPFLAIPLPKSKDNHQFYNAKNFYDQNFVG